LHYSTQERENKITTQHFKNIISELRCLVQESLEGGKAHDIITINLAGKTDIADYMIIASGTSDRHTSSLAQNLVKNIKEKMNYNNIRVEGASEGNWVLVDIGDIIVHIFKPEFREIYNLEKMWALPLSEPVLVC
jgi:ribosome-associated protein